MKGFAGLTILSIVLGVAIAEFAYLGLDALYPYASTSSGGRGAGGFTVPFGEVTLTALAFSPSEVKLTLKVVNYHITPYEELRVWIEDMGTRRAGLPEGFELVSGSIFWNGSAETSEVNMEATIRAVKDGEWRLTGVAMWYYHGSFQTEGSGILEIVVSNGRVTDIRRVEPEPVTGAEPTQGGVVRLYNLTIYSSPTGVTFTVDGLSH